MAALQKICTTDVVTVTKDTSIQEVARLMKEYNVGSVVVVESKEAQAKPIGILTDRDIVIEIVAESADVTVKSAEDIMNSDILTLNSKQDISEAVEAMQAAGVRRAPVVSENSEIIGVTSTDDLFVELAEELGCLANVIRQQIPASAQH